MDVTNLPIIGREFFDKARTRFTLDVPPALTDLTLTDFPRGDHNQLINSIVTRLWPMGDETVFIPGHGPESSFGRERQSNPYVAGT